MPPPRLARISFALLVSAASLLRAQTADPEPAHPAPASGTVEVWLTNGTGTKRLSRETPLTWSTSLSPGSTAVVIDGTTRHQTIDGFGATIKSTGLWQADPAMREEVMRLLFSRSTGIGLSLIRVPAGLEGLTGPDRTYLDLPPGQTDPALSGFSIEGDLDWKIPMMLRARELNPELTLMGTPWSAPAWMKTSGNLGFGKLKPEFYGAYADYFVKWLQAWRDQGLSLSVVTIQNEPQYEPYWYQGMRMDVADQIAFSQPLGLALENAGLSTRVLAWDHNCDNLAYPIAVLNDPAARDWIDGAAFHAYAGVTSDIYQFTEAHPDKDVYFTEQTGSYPSLGYGGSLAWHGRHIFLVPSLNHAKTNLTWKLDRFADELSGDRPVVRISPDGKSYALEAEYYELGHFAKFIRKGAVRLGTNNPRDAATRVFTGPLLYAAYQNPDGSRVLVACNEGSSSVAFTLEDLASPGRRVAYTLPAQSFATFVWRDATGGDGLAATYHDQPDFTGYSERRVDPAVAFDWGTGAPMPSLGYAGFSARWTGRLVAPASATYTLHIAHTDGVRLWVNNQLLVDNWQAQPATESSAAVALVAGQPADLRLDYFSSRAAGGGSVSLGWSSASLPRQLIPRSALYSAATATVPPPATRLIARAPSGPVLLSWTAAPTATAYTIRRATDPSGPFTTLVASQTATTYTDSAVTPGVAYTYVVSATNAQGTSTDSAPATVRPHGSTPPAPWTQLDIGSVGLAGSGGNSGDPAGLTLAGSGSDIWNSADSFRFAYFPLTGDGEIVARVSAQERTAGWAKSGLMLRATTAANSAHVSLVITPDNGVSLLSRATAGATSTSATVAGSITPVWLKLVRSGDTYSGFRSVDGLTWTQVGTTLTVSLGTTVQAGLAVCANNTSALNVTRFDSISAPGLAAPAPLAPTTPNAFAANGTVALLWSPVARATSYEILRAPTADGPYTVIGTTSGTTWLDTTLTNATPAHYRVRALNLAGASPDSAIAYATPSASALTRGWIDLDIGGTTYPGRTTATASQFTLQVASADIWGTADAFHYAWTLAPGDGQWTTRVASLANTGASAKAGILFRASHAANAPYVLLCVTPSTGVKFEYRTTPGASALAAATAGSITAPEWLRLTRAGNTYTARYSADGVTWTQLGAPITVELGATPLLGYALSGNNANAYANAVFDRGTATGFGLPAAPATLSATSDETTATLAWPTVSGATSYIVRRGTSPSGPFTLVGEPASATLTDTGLGSGVTYYYTIAPVLFGLEGAPSSATAVSTLVAAPGTPTGLVASGGDTTAALAWAAASGAQSYQIKRALSTDGPFAQIGATSATTYTDTGLTNGTAYFYRVAATNPAGTSADSATASATPQPANTAVWIGANNAPWSVATNWSGTPPTTGSPRFLSFAQTLANTSQNDLPGLIAASLTFPATAASHILTGQLLTLSGNLTAASSTPHTLALPLALSGVRTVDVATGGALALTGTLQDGSTPGGLVKTGAGALTLSGSASLTAAERLLINSASTVTLRHPAALGTADGSIRFANGVNTTLATQLDTPLLRQNLSGGSTASSTTLLLGRQTSGPAYVQPFGILDLGSRSLTVNTGANVSSGAMTAAFTELRLSAGNNDRPVLLTGDVAYSLGSASITLNALAKRLQLDGTSPASAITGSVANGIAGATVSLIKANTSTWTLHGANTYTGSTTVTGGVLVLKTATLADTATVSVSAPGVLHLDHGQTDLVGSLVIDGVTLPAGLHDATTTPRLTGTGRLFIGAPTAAPATFTTTTGDTQIALAWSAVPGAATYTIERALSASGPFTLLTTTTALAHTDTGLANGTTYFYRVTATNPAGSGPVSTTVSATPLPPLPGATSGLTATAGNTQISLAWSAATDATAYRIERAASASGPFTVLTTTSALTYTDAGLTNGTAYFYRVIATNLAGSGPASATASATPLAPLVLPTGWTSTDVGAPGAIGTAGSSGGIFTLQGAGTIWGSSDAFHFAHRAATSSVTLTARVTSLGNTDPHAAKAGVMLRESTAANARYAYVALTPSGELKFEYRNSTGGTAVSAGLITGFNTPVYVRLVRANKSFKAFYSLNGTTWTQFGANVSMNFASTCRGGLAVTSGLTGVLTTATFDQVTVP